MEDCDCRPIGPLLDGLGVTSQLDDDDLVESAVVLLKVIEADGEVRISVATTPGVSFIERIGMLRIAESTELDGLARDD